MNEEETKDPLPCGGNVALDQEGNIIRWYGCEAHLFDPGPPCEWQKRTNAQPREVRYGF